MYAVASDGLPELDPFLAEHDAALHARELDEPRPFPALLLVPVLTLNRALDLVLVLRHRIGAAAFTLRMIPGRRVLEPGHLLRIPEAPTEGRSGPEGTRHFRRDPDAGARVGEIVPVPAVIVPVGLQTPNELVIGAPTPIRSALVLLKHKACLSGQASRQPIPA